MGCGGGQVSLMLAECGYTAFGVDYSETAIDLAQRNAQAAGLKIRFSVGDCLSLDGFDDEAMDLVVDNHLLHCLIGPRDRLSFLRSAHRVLKPGGIMFSDTGSCEGNFDPLVMDADPVTRIARNHTRCWVSQADLNRELQATGWRVAHQEVRANAPWGAMIVTYAQRPCLPVSWPYDNCASNRASPRYAG
jgi:SAM-dependent methyltransferase